MKIFSLTTLAALGTGAYLLTTLGVDIKGLVNKYFNLKAFAQNAKIKLKHIYNFQIKGGITGQLHFLLDIDVANNSDSDITASNIQVNIYNEQNEFIGNSQNYASQVTLLANSTYTITGIEASVQLNKVIPDIAIPALIQVIQQGTFENFKFNQKLKLDVFVTLNGVSVNEQIYKEI